MAEQEDVRGGLQDDEVTVQQPDIDAAVARAVAVATEKLRTSSRRPLNAGPFTVAFAKAKKDRSAKGDAEQGGVKVHVTIDIVDEKDRKGDDLLDEVRYIDDTGNPQALSREDYDKAVKHEDVQGAEVAKDRAKK